MTYTQFWDWFQTQAAHFHEVVKTQGNIVEEFLDKIHEPLEEVHYGFAYLVGMIDEQTVELVITPDGAVEDIVFAEELIQAAPPIKGWKFTALKPAVDIEDFSLDMQNGYVFSAETLWFYANDLPAYPDEIEIVVVHKDYKEKDEDAILHGVYIFLDNYLGELNAVTTLDNVKVAGKSKATKELIPIAKLKSFLEWREKEFVEKYENLIHDTKADNYLVLKGMLPNKKPLLGAFNGTLLNWDKKPSHPWMVTLTFEYPAQDNGLPNDDAYKLMDDIEEEISTELPDIEGYLNVGRQTSDGSREVFFACKDFRKVSKVLYSFVQKYMEKDIDISYRIQKDKYWQTLNRFIVK